MTQAAILVGVSRRTINNWITAGKIEYYRTASGLVRIVKETLWQSDATYIPPERREQAKRAAAQVTAARRAHE